jgi:hypothetical protein
MCFGARREGCDLLDPDMHPAELAVAADSIGDAVEAVADNAEDPLHPRCGKGFDKLIRNSPRHAYLRSARRM